MIPRLPSLTAMVVCAARGLADARDPAAAELLPSPLGLAIRAGRHLPLAGRRLATGGLVDHLALRTAAIDAVAREGAARGVRQVVILGAGLDARAWRLPELAGSRVFEVDHPDTQAWKRRRAERLPHAAADVRLVPVDFARDALGAELARAGHDAAAPTLWIWEGVTPYLDAEAIAGTLAVVAERSAPGSLLAVTYATPSMSPLRRVLPEPVVSLGFAALGEPLRSLLEPAEMAARVEARGLAVVRDEGPAQWAARFPVRGTPWLVVHERLLVAEMPAPKRAA